MSTRALSHLPNQRPPLPAPGQKAENLQGAVPWRKPYAGSGDRVRPTLSVPGGSGLSGDFSRVPALGNLWGGTPALRTGLAIQRFPQGAAPAAGSCESCSDNLAGQETAPVAPEAPAFETTPAPTPAEPEAEPAPPEAAVPGGLIVADDAAEVEPGQMRQSDFLDALQTAVCAATGPVLAAAGRSIEGCPYLDYWFAYFGEKDAAYVERTLRRYAPEAAGAATASDYIPIVVARVRQGVERWAATGELTGVPEGLPSALPGGTAASAGGAGAGGPQRRVLFKARPGGARPVDDPQALQEHLGEGRPLESGVRSRMEGAFGINFAAVRLHTDSNAAASAHQQNARAFTVGQHVAFGAGEYRPGTPLGDALLAHELAHTCQQKGAESFAPAATTESSVSARLEADADHSALGAFISLWDRTKGQLQSAGSNVIPRLRSGLRLQRCKATPTPTLVKFQEDAKCSGFDDSISPHALMVPRGKTNTAKALIDSSIPANTVEFETDTGKATVSPKTPTATPQTITITGVAKGETRLNAKEQGKARVLGTLKLSVKDKLSKTAAIHSITDTSNTPNLVPTNPAAAANLQTYLNDTIWGKQANVYFTVTRTDKSVAYDLDNNKKLADPVLVSATSNEINAISGAAKSAADFNIYFINEMEVPHAFTSISRGETWIQDTHVNSTENVTAHELGHALGIGSESTDSKDVMYEVGDASNPCRVRKQDWDTVNP